MAAPRAGNEPAHLTSLTLSGSFPVFPWGAPPGLSSASYTSARSPPAIDRAAASYRDATRTSLERIVGNYLFAWILGVPAVVLAGIDLVSHL